MPKKHCKCSIHLLPAWELIKVRIGKSFVWAKRCSRCKLIKVLPSIGTFTKLRRS